MNIKINQISTKEITSFAYKIGYKKVKVIFVW